MNCRLDGLPDRPEPALYAGVHVTAAVGACPDSTTSMVVEAPSTTLETAGVTPIGARTEYRSRFTVPRGSVTLSRVAAPRTAERAWDGVAVGFFSRYVATTPLTCGQAIEVPEMAL